MKWLEGKHSLHREPYNMATFIGVWWGHYTTLTLDCGLDHGLDSGLHNWPYIILGQVQSPESRSILTRFGTKMPLSGDQKGFVLWAFVWLIFVVTPHMQCLHILCIHNSLLLTLNLEVTSQIIWHIHAIAFKAAWWVMQTLAVREDRF